MSEEVVRTFRSKLKTISQDYTRKLIIDCNKHIQWMGSYAATVMDSDLKNNIYDILRTPKAKTSFKKIHAPLKWLHTSMKLRKINGAQINSGNLLAVSQNPFRPLQAGPNIKTSINTSDSETLLFKDSAYNSTNISISEVKHADSSTSSCAETNQSDVAPQVKRVKDKLATLKAKLVSRTFRASSNIVAVDSQDIKSAPSSEPIYMPAEEVPYKNISMEVDPESQSLDSKDSPIRHHYSTITVSSTADELGASDKQFIPEDIVDASLVCTNKMDVVDHGDFEEQFSITQVDALESTQTEDNDGQGRISSQQELTPVKAGGLEEKNVATIVDEHGELPEISTDYSDEERSDSDCSEEVAEPQRTDTVKKPSVPHWAETPNLMKSLEDQSRRDPDAIFGAVKPLKLEDVFHGSKLKKFRDSCAGNWTGNDILTEEEEEKYKKNMGFG